MLLLRRLRWRAPNRGVVQSNLRPEPAPPLFFRYLRLVRPMGHPYKPHIPHKLRAAPIPHLTKAEGGIPPPRSSGTPGGAEGV